MGTLAMGKKYKFFPMLPPLKGAPPAPSAPSALFAPRQS